MKTQSFVVATYHSQKRFEERLYFPGKNIRYFIKLTNIYGISIDETTGDLYNYMLKYHHADAYTLIYKNIVFLYIGNRLITVWPLPKYYYKFIYKILKNRKKQNKSKGEKIYV